MQLGAEYVEVVYVGVWTIHGVRFALCISLYLHAAHAEIVVTFPHVLECIGATVYPTVLPNAVTYAAILKLKALCCRIPLKYYMVTILYCPHKIGRHREFVFHYLYIVYCPADSLLY